MTGRVFIDSMRMHAYHGVMEQERIVGNDYTVTLYVEFPIARACETDDVNDTVSYAELAAIVREEMLVNSALVEHVASRIIRKAAETYNTITRIYIKVTKIAPPMSVDCNGAGVEIEWERN